jgi:hypothetical protein
MLASALVASVRISSSTVGSRSCIEIASDVFYLVKPSTSIWCQAGVGRTLHPTGRSEPNTGHHKGRLLGDDQAKTGR